MQSKLRNTVLQLQDKSYIHFSKVQKYNKFGYHALFVNRDKGSIFQVHYFSKSVLELNALLEHLQKSIARFRTLNFRKITPILEVQQKKQEIYIISPGFYFSLSQLIRKRQGLSEFQVAYFLGQMYQLMGYLKSREVFIQKIEADDLSLTQQLKLTVGFNLFLNGLAERPIIKRLPFRIQYRNRNNCLDLFFKKQILNSTIDEVNAWNMGVIAYQIIENKLPFPHVNDDLIGRVRGLKENQMIDLLNKQYNLSFSEAKHYPQLIDLIKKLLKPNPVDRLKFSFVIIHAFIKNFRILPHILPSTVFYCPPSENYKQQYFKKFSKEERQIGTQFIKELKFLASQQNLRTQKDIKDSDFIQRDKFIKSQIEICSTSNLSDNFVIIEEFADISDVFGYGYQMNTGMVGFVFNDQTQFLCFNGSQEIRCRNKGKRKHQIIYSQQKIPQEDEIRKKIHILEAFSKTLKRKKTSASEREKTIVVSDYCRTKYASIFLLTNNALQAFFNDKMIFYLLKGETYIQQKNSQKLQKYDLSKSDPDLNLRKQYCRTVAQKVFLWQTNEQPTILDGGPQEQQTQ